MSMEVPILSATIVQWEDSVVMHDFLLTSSCAIALLGRDLMGKLGMTLQFGLMGCQILGKGMDQPPKAFLRTLSLEG